MEVELLELLILFLFDGLLPAPVPHVDTGNERLNLVLRDTPLLMQCRMFSVRLERRINVFRVPHQTLIVDDLLELLGFQSSLPDHIFVPMMYRSHLSPLKNLL